LSRLAQCTPRGSTGVKGFDNAIEVWKVDRLAEARSSDSYGEIIGRHGELHQFTTLLERCLARGGGHTILVRGEPGIGKTRLVEQFASIALERGVAVHKALVLDFGVGKGQDAIRDLTRSLLSITSGGDQDERQAAAEGAIRSLGLVPEDGRMFLNDLLDLPQPEELRRLYQGMDSASRNLGIQRTLCQLIAILARTKPLLILIEDIHWADHATLNHLVRIASTVGACAALLVMTTRVGSKSKEDELAASVWQSPITVMEVLPLPPEDASTLARQLSKREIAHVETLVRRAEGNPLFLVQLAMNASDDAVSQLPGTLMGLVQARVDRLPERDRSALQAASVIGQRFSLDALREVARDESYECNRLIQARLVRPEESAYLFAHALIQEGTYSSLLRVRRKDLHIRAACWFADRDLVLHAEHLDRAGDPTAPQAYLKAARAEVQQARYERGLQLARRAIEIRPAAEGYSLRCLEGECLRHLGLLAESIRAFEQALEIAVHEVDRCHAWIGVAEGLRISGDFNRLLEALEQAEAVAQAHELLPELARIYQLRGGVFFVRGEILECLSSNNMALNYARMANSFEFEAHALSGLGDAEFARGRMISAHIYYSQCIDLSRAQALSRTIAANLPQRGQTLLYRNQLVAALNDCRESASLAERICQPRAELVAGIVAAYILDMGISKEGKHWTERGLSLARRLGARLFESVVLECMARIAARDGALAEAESLIREALAILRRSDGMRFQGPKQLGAFALIVKNPNDRQAALCEGQEILRVGVSGHNHLWFYRDAMEVSLMSSAWDETERYADALAAYTSDEVLPWSDFFIARSRALVSYGRGQRSKANLEHIKALRDQAAEVGFTTAIPALDDAFRAK
jgi:tetratricopeptide (TPR) repeat protein